MGRWNLPRFLELLTHCDDRATVESKALFDSTRALCYHAIAREKMDVAIQAVSQMFFDRHVNTGILTENCA